MHSESSTAVYSTIWMMIFLCGLDIEVNKLLDYIHLFFLLFFIHGIEYTREDKSSVTIVIWLVNI